MIPNNFTFSIIIPTYNRSFALDRCLKSLVNQTFKNFEVLVCDDGSTDDTKQIVEKYRDILNLNYFFAENWGGPAKPRNTGIANSSSDWICFLDSDDVWYPEKLQNCLAYLNTYDVICHNVNFESVRGRVKAHKTMQFDNNNVFADLLVNGNTIIMSSVCIRKSILIELDGFSLSSDLIGVEDFDLWLRVGMRKYKFKAIELFLGANWIGLENISSLPKQFSQIDTVYSKYIILLSDSEKKRFAEGMKNYILARVSHRQNDYKSAINLYKNAFKSSKNPTKLRALYFLILALMKYKHIQL